MKISRNAILKNVGPLLENAPEKIYGLVARLLDEKELTEAKEAGLKRQADAMKSLYDGQKGRFQEAVRENGVLTRLLGELRGKVESLALDCERFKAKFEEAIERIGQLEDALADAKEEKVEAVSHNRELQEKPGTRIRILIRMIQPWKRRGEARSALPTAGCTAARHGQGLVLS